METIIRQVRDLESGERRVLEHVIGQRLQENQKVIIQVVAPENEPAVEALASGTGKLPEWCNVYEGLTEEQVAAVEEVILQRSDLTRPSE
jgi:hypothetical protein